MADNIATGSCGLETGKTEEIAPEKGGDTLIPGVKDQTQISAGPYERNGVIPGAKSFPRTGTEQVGRPSISNDTLNSVEEIVPGPQMIVAQEIECGSGDCRIQNVAHGLDENQSFIEAENNTPANASIITDGTPSPANKDQKTNAQELEGADTGEFEIPIDIEPENEEDFSEGFNHLDQVPPNDNFWDRIYKLFRKGKFMRNYPLTSALNSLHSTKEEMFSDYKATFENLLNQEISNLKSKNLVENVKKVFEELRENILETRDKKEFDFYRIQILKGSIDNFIKNTGRYLLPLYIILRRPLETIERSAALFDIKGATKGHAEIKDNLRDYEVKKSVVERIQKQFGLNIKTSLIELVGMLENLIIFMKQEKQKTIISIDEKSRLFEPSSAKAENILKDWDVNSDIYPIDHDLILKNTDRESVVLLGIDRQCETLYKAGLDRNSILRKIRDTFKNTQIFSEKRRLAHMTIYLNTGFDFGNYVRNLVDFHFNPLKQEPKLDNIYADELLPPEERIQKIVSYWKSSNKRFKNEKFDTKSVYPISNINLSNKFLVDLLKSFVRCHCEELYFRKALDDEIFETLDRYVSNTVDKLGNPQFTISINVENNIKEIIEEKLEELKAENTEFEKRRDIRKQIEYNARMAKVKTSEHVLRKDVFIEDEPNQKLEIGFFKKVKTFVNNRILRPLRKPLILVPTLGVLIFGTYKMTRNSNPISVQEDVLKLRKDKREKNSEVKMSWLSKMKHKITGIKGLFEENFERKMDFENAKLAASGEISKAFKEADFSAENSFWGKGGIDFTGTTAAMESMRKSAANGAEGIERKQDLEKGPKIEIVDYKIEEGDTRWGYVFDKGSGWFYRSGFDGTNLGKKLKKVSPMTIVRALDILSEGELMRMGEIRSFTNKNFRTRAGKLYAAHNISPDRLLKLFGLDLRSLTEEEKYLFAYEIDIMRSIDKDARNVYEVIKTMEKNRKKMEINKNKLAYDDPLIPVFVEEVGEVDGVKTVKKNKKGLFAKFKGLFKKDSKRKENLDIPIFVENSENVEKRKKGWFAKIKGLFKNDFKRQESLDIPIFVDNSNVVPLRRRGVKSKFKEVFSKFFRSSRKKNANNVGKAVAVNEDEDLIPIHVSEEILDVEDSKIPIYIKHS